MPSTLYSTFEGSEFVLTFVHLPVTTLVPTSTFVIVPFLVSALSAYTATMLSSLISDNLLTPERINALSSTFVSSSSGKSYDKSDLSDVIFLSWLALICLASFSDHEAIEKISVIVLPEILHAIVKVSPSYASVNIFAVPSALFTNEVTPAFYLEVSANEVTSSVAFFAPAFVNTE